MIVCRTAKYTQYRHTVCIIQEARKWSNARMEMNHFYCVYSLGVDTSHSKFEINLPSHYEDRRSLTILLLNLFPFTHFSKIAITCMCFSQFSWNLEGCKIAHLQSNFCCDWKNGRVMCDFKNYKCICCHICSVKCLIE